MFVFVNLEVGVKYCDVYVVVIVGWGVFIVKYGNFKFDGLGEDSDIILVYGNGILVCVWDLNIDFVYGNFDV